MTAPAAPRQRGPARPSARPPIRAVPGLLAAAIRLAHGVLRLALTLAAAVPFALLALLWRLEQGPVDLDWAASRLAPGLGPVLAGPGGRLHLGHATAQWHGFSAGPDAGLELRLHSATLHAPTPPDTTSPPGTPPPGADLTLPPVLAAGPAAITLPLGTLLRGVATPASLHLSSLDIHLVRDAAGLRLEGTAPPLSDAPPSAPGLANHPVWPLHLRALHLDRAAVTLRDAALGPATLRFGPLDLQADTQPDTQPGTPPEAPLRARTAGTLALGPATADFTLEAEHAPAATALHLALAATQASPLAAALSPLLPPSLPADTLDAPLSTRATLHLGAGLRPRSLSLSLAAGPGQLRIADKRLRLAALQATAEATWSTPPATTPSPTATWSRPDRLVVPAARVTLPSPGTGPDTTLAASLDLRDSPSGTPPGTLSGTAELSLDRLAFADLPALWPAGLAHHIRPWLTENITVGTARDATLRVAFDAPADLSAATLRTVDGRLAGDDLTIHWLRPAPPIEHASALLTIAAPDRLDIAIPTARQGALALRAGTVRITGLDVKDQFLSLAADTAGTVPELLALLRHPRLNLLSKHPLPMRDPAGTFDGHLAVDLPLNHDLRFDQVRIATQARFAGLHLGGLVAGRDLDRGTVTLDATADGLRATGRALVGTIPAQLSIGMDFRPGPPDQTVETARLAATATAPQLAAAGLDPAPVMEGGTLALTARYEGRRNGTARLAATADARAAALALAGWRKPPGPPADFAATVLLDHDTLVGIEDVRATGPGLLLDARIHPVDGRPLDLELRRVVLGRSEATGSLRLPATPGGALVARLSGPTLDLSTQFGTPDTPRTDTPRPDTRSDSPRTPFVADISFDRVLLARGTALAAVSGHAEHDGTRISALHVTTGGPERLQADIWRETSGAPSGAPSATSSGTRRITLRAADAGAALRALDVTDTVHGGALAADGVFDDRSPGSPLSGRAELTGFHVGKGVAVGKLLQALTLYGLPDALSGPGVRFDRLLLPFRWDGTVLQVTGARAFSPSLGLTAEGTLDNRRNTLDLHGTVVPAYLLNSLLGRLPGIGHLFSAEQGGGLLALDWSLRGPAGDPALRVNPLSLLTPGILRNIFK